MKHIISSLYRGKDATRRTTGTDVSRRIHVLGVGNIGKLVAHAIRGLPDAPPVTLLFHRRVLLDAWKQSAKAITVKYEKDQLSRVGFDVEFVQHEKHSSAHPPTDEAPASIIDLNKVRSTSVIEERATGPLPSICRKHDQFQSSSADASSETPIQNLLVATKTVDTVCALAAIIRRLASNSTICFLQNGAGIVEEVDKTLFRSPLGRPSYIQCVISHGVHTVGALPTQDPFCVNHVRHGTISFATVHPKLQELVPKRSNKHRKQDATSISRPGVDNDSNQEPSESSCYLSSILKKCEALDAARVTPFELLQLQMEKIAVNAIVNPLTALLDISCGDLMQYPGLSTIVRLILNEIASVLQNLPELRHLPGSQHRFDVARLEGLVESVCETSRHHISSMLADVRACRQTEIEYINGYVIRRASEVGIKCPINVAVVKAVLARCTAHRATQIATPGSAFAEYFS